MFTSAKTGLTSAALLAALTLAASPAAVVHLDLSGAPLPIPDTLEGLYLNVVTGLTSTADVPPAGWDFNPYNRGDSLAFFGPTSPAGQGTLANGTAAIALLGGETIGPTGLFSSGQLLGTAFLTTGRHYAGFRFFNETTGQINYAWAELATTEGTGFPASLRGYAYENTGASLAAGQIPEPAPVTFTAGLAFLLTARRNRRPA